MDIRKASKNKNVVGTKGPEILTQEKETPIAPTVDEETGAATVQKSTLSEDVENVYLKYLGENGISREDLQDILSSIITSGNVIWNFELFEKIPVEFQIRKTWVNDYILELVDNETTGNQKVSVLRYNNLVAVCNLAASMTRYGKETYKLENRKDFDKARERVQNLSYIVQNALINKLAVFDRAVAAATSEWGVKNFMKSQKDK